MKLPRAAGALLVLALVGCESVSDASQRLRDRLGARREPRMRVYSADQRATYAAARTAIERMGFRFLRGGPAQGEIDAVNAVAADDSLRGARQVAMSIRLAPAPGGGTEVSVTLDEIVETDSRNRAGQGTAAPLRDTPLYEVLFRNVQQALDARPRG